MDGSDIRDSSDLHLGRIVAVSASQAVALLEKPHGPAALAGPLALQMGALVKMHTRISIVYGMVTGLRVPLPSLEPSDKDLKLVELELVGEIRETEASPALFSAASPPTRRWTSRSSLPPRRILRRSMRGRRW
jgi:hypothetical protein